MLKVAFYVDENGCWICTSHSPLTHDQRTGYYCCKVDGKTIRMHRQMYLMVKGPIPEGNVVRHTCDNSRCINPAHLKVGSHADNVQDRVDRDRSAKGEQNGRSKLTEADVKNIRADNTTPNVTMARIYHVDPKAIYDIRHRNTWKHVS